VDENRRTEVLRALPWAGLLRPLRGEVPNAQHQNRIGERIRSKIRKSGIAREWNTTRSISREGLRASSGTAIANSLVSLL
jgi:hypothetical protein